MTAPHGMKIHGGMQMAGRDAGVQNFELEELEVDPINPALGRMWVNTLEKKIKYVAALTEQGEPIVEALTTNAELAQLVQTLNYGTTLAHYGITDAVSMALLNTPNGIPTLDANGFIDGGIF